MRYDEEHSAMPVKKRFDMEMEYLADFSAVHAQARSKIIKGSRNRSNPESSNLTSRMGKSRYFFLTRQ